MNEMNRQAVIVLPTMTMITGVEELGDVSATMEVGVVVCLWVTVRVTVFLFTLLLKRVIPKLLNAVLVNAVAAHPCCVNTILSYMKCHS